MEASLPSLSWRGKGSVGLSSHLLDWNWQCFAGLSFQNSSSMPALTHLAHDWLSPTPPVSMGAGVLERVAGVSVTGVTVALALGSLELVAGVSTFFCMSRWDSLGVNWGRLGNGTPTRLGHLWRWPC